MPDDSALLHGRVYDPAKAREYYLRTRHLKGRRAGVAQRVSSRTATLKATPTLKSASRDQAEARLAALKGRLEQLRKLLAERVEIAQKRSGVDKKDPNDAASPADKQKEEKGKSPSTAAEKREAAKRSKEWREKHPNKLPPSGGGTNVSEEIAAVQKQIAEVQDQLKAAIAKARNSPNKPKSKTA
jgi:hypothetical protein